ncbi:MAG: hypothetical protein AAB728_02920 [Patescibacteria group bacterium]
MLRFRLWLFLGLLSFPLGAIAIPESAPTVIPRSWDEGACNIITGELHFGCFPILLAYLIQYLFMGIGMLALIQIMIAGYQWAVGSFGEGAPTTVDSAKKRLRAAIVGLVFSILVFAIINFVISSITLGT